MKSYEILERGLALVEDPRRWIRGARFGTDREDGHLGYCAMGALLKTTLGGCTDEVVYSQVWASPRFFPYNAAVRALARAMHGRDLDPVELKFNGPRCDAVEWFNDKHTHRVVVRAFQTAIRAEKARHGIHAELPVPNEAPARLVAYA